MRPAAMRAVFFCSAIRTPAPTANGPAPQQPDAEPRMSRVSDEMALDTRREPRRIADAYSQGEQRRRRGHIVETRMGSGLAGGLLCRYSLVWGQPHVARSFAHPIPPRHCAAMMGFASGC